MPINYSERRKPELLSPAGNMESFFAAVENGADAVYVGLKDFSARAGAENFSLDDTGNVIAYARKRCVRVYIALNTLLKTSELEEAVDILIALEEMRPDAIILQDMGLLYLIQSQFPGLNLHASTQMAIHNLAGVKQLEQSGFKRVVLARELSIPEIKHISGNSSIEIEVFVHGALCYSYSGLCLFSSMIGGRSGNRGRCAQPCRMYYRSPSGDGGYLFSMKDLLTISGISDLVDAGITSFKIEGRMKSPEYVAAVTNAYRRAIDGKLSNQSEAVNRIKTVFSRETTSAYLRHNLKTGHNSDRRQFKAADMINPSYPANVGLYAGEVIKQENSHLVIRAEAAIGVRDLLQIFEDATAKPTLLHVKTIKVSGKRVFHINAGDIATINSEQQITRGAKLFIISSRNVKEMFTQKIPKKLISVKIPVNLEVKIMPESIMIHGTVMQSSFIKEYPVKLDKSIHHAIDDDGIRECFSRLGETPFELAIMHTDISERLFIPLSLLNDVRRDYFHELSTAWRKEREQRGKNTKNWLKEMFIKHHNFTGKGNGSENSIPMDKIRLSIKIDRLNCLNTILSENIYKVYIVLTGKTVTHLEESSDIADTLLREKDKVVFSLPAIMRDMGNGLETYDYFRKSVRALTARGFRQFQISNPGAMDLFAEEEVLLYADYALYALNPLSAIKLREQGFCRHTLSPEDDSENLQTLFSEDAEMILYQDTPLFTSETCVWANMKGTCPGISKCKFEQTTLVNEHNDRFIAVNETCRTVVINERPFSLTHLIPTIFDAGQRNFRIDLCYRDYTPEMIHNIFSGIQGRTKMRNSTIGNFERQLL